MRKPLPVRSSALLKLALNESRTTPLEFYDDAPYPDHRAVKDEIEQFVAEHLAGASAADLAVALERHRDHLTSWVPHRLEGADREEVARLCAFAELHAQLLQAEDELMLASLGPPKADDLVFDAEPKLFGALTDGLMRLLPAQIEEQWTATNAAFFLPEGVVFPHPFLAQYRELLGVLAELAGDPRLRVYVALDPYRRAQREDLQYRLLEDYWDGMKLTAESLDSLDAHDQGTSFHAAGERWEAEELFNPLLGTWFDWRARGMTRETLSSDSMYERSSRRRARLGASCRPSSIGPYTLSGTRVRVGFRTSMGRSVGIRSRRIRRVPRTHGQTLAHLSAPASSGASTVSSAMSSSLSSPDRSSEATS
jgi:hypothetical protein